MTNSLLLMLNIAMMLCIILILINVIERLLDLFKKFKKENNSYTDYFSNIEEDTIVSLKQQQLYNIEKYKQRMQKMHDEADEDGLVEENRSVTIEELGYFTGVEENE